MELKYDVIIDTNQAIKATNELEKNFKKLGDSTEKDVRKIGEMGSEIVEAMKGGKITTEEARKKFAQLTKEIDKLTKSGRRFGQEEKAALRASYDGTRKVISEVVRLEKARTEAHNKHLKQMKREEEAEKRMNENKRIFDKDGTGGGIIGGVGRSLKGSAQMAIVMAAIASLGALVTRYKDLFSDVFEFIKDRFDDLKYYMDVVVSNLPFFKNNPNKPNANENFYRSKRDSLLGRYLEYFDKLGVAQSGGKGANTAIEYLIKKIPELKKLSTDENELKIKIQTGGESIRKIIEDSYKEAAMKEAEKVSKKLSPYADIETLKQVKEDNKRQEEEERSRGRYNKRKWENLNRRIDEQMKKAEEYSPETIYNKLLNDYNIELGKKIKERTDAEEKARQTAERKARAEAEAIKSLNKIAQSNESGDNTYSGLLGKAKNQRDADLKLLKELSEWKDRPEYKQAEERSAKRYEEATKEANEMLKKILGDAQKELDDKGKSAFDKELESIKEYYEQKRKFLNDFLKASDNLTPQQKYELEEQRKEAEMAYKTAEAIETENKTRNERIRLINEEAEKKEKESENIFDDIKRAKALNNAELERLRLELKELETQRNISNEEAKRIEYLKQQKQQLEDYGELLVKLERANNVQYFSEIGSNLRNSNNPFISSIGNAFGGISGAAEIYKQRLNGDIKGAWASAISQAVSFGIDVMNSYSESLEQGRQALEEWNTKVSDSAHNLAMLELEELEYKQKNIYGIENPYDKLNAALRQGIEADKKTVEAMEMLKEGQVQIGTRDKLNGKKTASLIASGIASGAAIGAAAGSAATPIGTAIGAVVGAIGGLFSSLFAAREKVPEYESIEKKYGQIYDPETLEINKQILADYDKMDDATKRLVDNFKEVLEVSKKAHENYLEYIKEMTGEMGEDIRDILYDAFRNEQIFASIDNVRNYIGDVIGDMFQKEIFAAVFGEAFSGLQEQFKRMRNPETGIVDGRIDEVIAPFFNIIDKGLVDYDMMMKKAQERYSKMGYDIFRSDSEQDGQRALQGAISGMTEETAGKINGNFMGLKMTAMEIADRVSSINDLMSENIRLAQAGTSHLKMIAENTEKSTILQSAISEKLTSIKNDGLIVK